jgi:hypothetical protein
MDGFSKKEIISLIELFSQAASELKGAVIEQLPIEMAIVKWCEEKPKAPPPRRAGSPADNGDLEQEVKVSGNGESLAKVITDGVWSKVLAGVRVINTSIEALLRATKPISLDGDVLTLGVYYRFHKERLEEPSHRKILEEVVTRVLGSPVRVTCVLTSPPAKKVVEEPKEKVILTQTEDEDIIKIAKEIFGN